MHGFLEERADFLRVDVRPSVEAEGWNIVLRLDGSYAIPELSDVCLDNVREELARMLLAEIPGIELIWWNGAPVEDDDEPQPSDAATNGGGAR